MARSLSSAQSDKPLRNAFERKGYAPVAVTAIISDIHGNLEGLRAVLADVKRQGITDIICLGDVVGYGPNPRECVDLVRRHCRLTIRGNHDEAVIQGPIGFTPLAREAMEWTRNLLKPWPLPWRTTSQERWKFLNELPLQETWKGFLLVHGSPRDPTSEYIMDREIYMGDTNKFDEIFAKFDTVCFVGHTHIPGVFKDRPSFSFRKQHDIEGAFEFNGEKMVINVGSVGQPRDRDPRACYLTVDPDKNTFEYHRVEYDKEKTRDKIHSISSLSPQLGDRLLEGI